MILENLLTLVETLRKRVDDHGDALRQSEALTRYVLIDPLLRELGWNTEDPNMVRPEFRLQNASGHRTADYALLNNGKPVMMLEAKKLDTNLQDDAVEQGIIYCLQEGTGYFSVTDGRRWEIYATHIKVPIDDKRLISFDLKTNSTPKVCLKALALWRPSVISGHVQVGQTPIVGLGDEQTSTTESQPIQGTTVQAPGDENEGVSLSTMGSGQSVPTQDEQGWQPLSELNLQSGGPKPTEISFPNNTTVSIETWKDMMDKAVHWLIENKKLNENDCPIRPKGYSRCLVNTSPKHLDGKNFTSPKQIGTFYIETNYGGRYIIPPVKAIIQYVGQDPAQFKVRW